MVGVETARHSTRLRTQASEPNVWMLDLRFNVGPEL
jgi:hypothetical protein